MITIGNVKKGDRGEYCGRPYRSHKGSPLANPFPMRHESARDAVCDGYDRWFSAQLLFKNEAVLAELDRLEDIARRGDLTLLCHCAPRRCHCSTIRVEIERRLARPSA